MTFLGLIPFWLFFLPFCLLFFLCTSLLAILFPSGFEWHYSPPFISAEFSCCSSTHWHRHTSTHFLRHKTMSAGRIFLAARSSVYCMILDVLKGNLCSHTYLVTLSLPFLSPPENWISIAVVPCDVPVPDKSLMSLCAYRQKHTHEGTRTRLFVG